MSVTYQTHTSETEKGFWTLFPGLCKGCGLCIQKCPKECMSWSDMLGVYGTPAVKITDECTACGICQTNCPDCAIAVEKKKKRKISQ